jgi:hypothetical protein
MYMSPACQRRGTKQRESEREKDTPGDGVPHGAALSVEEDASPWPYGAANPCAVAGGGFSAHVQRSSGKEKITLTARFSSPTLRFC